jgi:hypothetical protein
VQGPGPGGLPGPGTSYDYAVGDLNGDGFADIAMSVWSLAHVTIFMGNDAGAFQPAVQTDTSFYPSSFLITQGGAPLREILVITGPMIGDIWQDEGLSVAEVEETGALNIIDAPRGDFSSAYAIAADLNCDGLTDFVVGGYGTDVYLGTGDGGWSAGSLATASDDIGVGDFTDDGIPDLLVSPATYPVEIDVLPGNGDGTFSTVPIVTGSTSGQYISEVYSCEIGDLNEDGQLDLLLSFPTGDQPAFVLFGRGDGTFATGPTLTGLTMNVGSVTLQDLNGDGHLDYVAVDFKGGHVYLALGNGDGTFQAETVVSDTATPDGGLGLWLEIAEVNSDGRPDLVEINQDTGDLSFLINQCR